MSNSEFGSITLVLLTFLAAAHLLGWLFARLRQPRVVGEILAGVLLGPSIFGRLAPHASKLLASSSGDTVVLGFLYNLGLLLLMFASGAETRGLFNREDRREVAWLGAVGTGLPFVLALMVAPFLPLQSLIGPAHQRAALLLVVSIAVAVTSIPVISKILHDLKILHTRFARLVLGVAVLEDIVLWAVLAVATAIAQSGSVPKNAIIRHVLAACVFFAVGLLLAPRLIRRITRARWNVLAKGSPVAYIILILLAYTAIAAALDVSLVFAAFLAGYAVVSETDLSEAIRTVSHISFAVFIPIYFTVVGYKLDLGKSFDIRLLAVFLAAGCFVKMFSAGMGARLAGFAWLDSANLSVALNARGGPGIVLASVAFDAGIINAAFYTTLVVMAVLTSQAAGAWLDYILKKGKPLLQAQVTSEPAELATDESLAA